MTRLLVLLALTACTAQRVERETDSVRAACIRQRTVDSLALEYVCGAANATCTAESKAKALADGDSSAVCRAMVKK
jgi:hypothetical protein